MPEDNMLRRAAGTSDDVTCQDSHSPGIPDNFKSNPISDEHEKNRPQGSPPVKQEQSAPVLGCTWCAEIISSDEQELVRCIRCHRNVHFSCHKANSQTIVCVCRQCQKNIVNEKKVSGDDGGSKVLIEAPKNEHHADEDNNNGPPDQHPTRPQSKSEAAKESEPAGPATPETTNRRIRLSPGQQLDPFDEEVRQNRGLYLLAMLQWMDHLEQARPQ
jgi:hypothetical protein